MRKFHQNFGVVFLLNLLSVLLFFGPYQDRAIADGTVQLHKVQTIKGEFVVTAIAWHPGGEKIAIGQSLNKKISVLDIHGGKPIYTIESEPGGVSALAYSPNGKFLAVGRNFSAHTEHNINVYDQSGKVVYSFVPPRASKGSVNNDVNSIAFSPDGKYLSAHGYGGGAVGVVYSLSDGSVVAKLAPSTSETDAITSMDWNSEGKRIALGRASGRLEIWDAVTWQLLQKKDIRKGRISSLAFGKNNYLAIGSFKYLVTERDKEAFSRLPENFRKKNPAPSNEPHDLYLVDIDSVNVKSLLSTSHDKGIRKLAVTPDGKFLLSSSNSSIAVHEFENGKEVAFIEDFKEQTHSALSKDGRFVVVSSGQEVVLYELIR